MAIETCQNPMMVITDVKSIDDNYCSLIIVCSRIASMRLLQNFHLITRVKHFVFFGSHMTMHRQIWGEKQLERDNIDN
jgi:hypothetical protein